MADTKISALTASTTPLAGTEVLPIVQSGTTKQVSVANLTTGRAISATQLTLTTGNLIVANGQGIDFSATPGTGTSELLADYEEGTYTPTIGDGTNNYTAGNAYGFYTKVGNRVIVNGVISWTSIGSAGGGQLLISLPIAISATLFNRNGASLGYVDGLDNGVLKQITVAADGNTQRLSFWQLNDNAAPTAIAANSSSASGEVQFSVSYFV